MAADSDDIRVTIAGRELPAEDVQAEVVAALIIGAVATAALVLMIVGV